MEDQQQDDRVAERINQLLEVKSETSKKDDSEEEAEENQID